MIRRFYEAFSQRDAATMAAQYADDVHFRDRVFPNLHGDQAGAMWAMLCESEDLVVTFSGVRADERYGVARWEARYSLFGNEIHNVIDASFELVEGKIVNHVDDFDFTRWVGQALPGPSKVLGPTPGAVLRAAPAVRTSRLAAHVAFGEALTRADYVSGQRRFCPICVIAQYELGKLHCQVGQYASALERFKYVFHSLSLHALSLHALSLHALPLHSLPYVTHPFSPYISGYSIVFCSSLTQTPWCPICHTPIHRRKNPISPPYNHRSWSFCSAALLLCPSECVQQLKLHLAWCHALLGRAHEADAIYTEV